MSDIVPQLPAPAGTGPSGGAEPPFRSRETRPPALGLGIEEALAKLQRRRAEQAEQPPQQQPEPPAADRPPQQPPAPDRPAQLPPPDAQMPYPPMGEGRLPAPGQGLPGEPRLPAPDDAASLVVQVEVDGQLVPVTVDELRRGYLREIDYRRKSQQVTTEVRKAQEAQQQFAAARTALEQRLPAYTQQFQNEFSTPVDWEKLAREDPIGSVQKIARLLAAQQVAAEAQQLQQARAQEDLVRKQQLLAAAHEVLCRAIPGWADPATRTTIQQAIAQHAVSLGYPAEQVANAEVLDPREILMAWKSMNYDRLMSARVQPQPAGARTLNGNGINRRQPQAAALTELEERFRSTGNVDDALAVLRARRATEARPDQPQLGRMR